ncbi:MAG TPA: TraR/DksA C4-type zinc finger protein [Thermoleophilaceae bacterium]
MTEFDKQQVETRLRERAEEIAARRAQLKASPASLDPELADYDQHPADQGTETHEQELDETTDMLLADEADRVELALQRLGEGNYGVCIDCGRDIPAERLEAIPESVRCIDDQARWEATLRARGLPPNRGR